MDLVSWFRKQLYLGEYLREESCLAFKMFLSSLTWSLCMSPCELYPGPKEALVLIGSRLQLGSEIAAASYNPIVPLFLREAILALLQ